MVASARYEAGSPKDATTCLRAVHSLEGLQKMNHLRISLAVLLTAVLTGLFTVGTRVFGRKAQSTALERGYRTGYSDRLQLRYR
jgi:hypothetical protein